MILVEILDNDLKRTYSDEGVMIRRVGTNQLYEEAIDPIDVERNYIETDIVIEIEETTEAEGNELVN